MKRQQLSHPAAAHQQAELGSQRSDSRGLDKQPHPDERRRQRSACDASKRGLSLAPLARRSDPAPHQCARGAQDKKRRTLRSAAAGCAGQCATTAPLSCPGTSSRDSVAGTDCVRQGNCMRTASCAQCA